MAQGPSVLPALSFCPADFHSWASEMIAVAIKLVTQCYTIAPNFILCGLFSVLMLIIPLYVTLGRLTGEVLKNRTISN